MISCSKELKEQGLVVHESINSESLAKVYSDAPKSGSFIYVKKTLKASVSVDSREELVILIDDLASLDIVLTNPGKINIIHKKGSYSSIIILNNKDVKSQLQCDLEKDSIANIFFGIFEGQKSTLRIDNHLNGEGSEAYVNGVFFSSKTQNFEITTNSNHNTRNTKGDIVVRGALDGESKVIFKGDIKIIKGAQKTNSFLQNHNLLLSKDCICESVPSLEIDANDVQASHGATIGRPSDEDLFYIMSRGLAKKQAEKLIISGFFSKVIDKIGQVDIRNKFESALSAKVT
ncbi:MAG: SufD family Fe-S cluster assembly protein [archaeon]